MSMRQEPEFYALVDEPNAGGAYSATVSALYDPVVVNDPKRDRLRLDIAAAGSSLEEVLAALGEPLRHGGGSVRIPFLTRSQRYLLDVSLTTERVGDGGGSPSCLLSVRNTDIMHQDFIVPSDFYDAAARDELSVPVSAAILGHIWQGHLDQVFLAMCAPDAQSRVKMGVYNVLDKFYGLGMTAVGSIGWHAPLEMAATYHGNHEVARDLAFSWLHLHDGRAIDSVVHLSLDDLITRVEAAPRGTSIGISSRTEHAVKHGLDQSNACTLAEDQVTAMNWSVGPRLHYPEDDELTREHVLATLQTPSETLLQALEAAAAPDAEWIEAEKRALDVLDGLNKEGEPSRWLRLDRFEQRCFLEEHAPFRVRRLPNGGVMLAAYPYGHLWALWARALDSLGISPATT